MWISISNFELTWNDHVVGFGRPANCDLEIPAFDLCMCAIARTNSTRSHFGHVAHLPIIPTKFSSPLCFL